VELPEGVRKLLQGAGVLDALQWDGRPASAPQERSGPSKLDQLRVRMRLRLNAISRGEGRGIF